MRHSIPLHRLLPLLTLLTAAACRQFADDPSDAAWESLIATERAFASTSVANGARNAFLGYLADDAILFDDGPVGGRALWEGRSESEATLIWGPEIADVSSAGDMGYTSGPWAVHITEDSIADGWGHFVSVWMRDSTGEWKLAIDGGIAHGPVDVAIERFVERVAGGSASTVDPVEVDLGVARASLAEANTAYSRAVMEIGFLHALDRFVDPAARFYRNGDLPLEGLDAIGAAEAVTGAVWTEWEGADPTVSRSGDMGFTYGVVRSSRESDSAASAWPASYYRIWRRHADTPWRVVVDVLIPFAPTAQ